MNSCPSKPTVIFDGSCQVCTGQMEKFQKQDANGDIAFVSKHDSQAKQFPQLAEPGNESGLRVVDENGQVHVGADAVYQISKRLPKLRWVAWLYRIPGLRGIFRAGYRWLSARRSV